MSEIICIDDVFHPRDEAYFRTHGITKPKEGEIYTVRKVIPYPIGEPGLLLNEIVNQPSPKVSPTTGIEGTAEQSWAASRFTDLQGNKLTAEALRTISKPQTVESCPEK